MNMKKKEKNKIRLFSFRYLIYDIVKITAGIPGLLWFRPKWVYESKEAKRRIRGGALVVSNHYGFFDPLYVMYAIWYRRHRFICGKELYESKGHFFLKSFMCIPVDRANFGINSLRSIADALKIGALVSIFPEGHINEAGNGLASFKSGMVLMALQGRAPIVPVYVEPRKKIYSRLRFVIGEPVDIISEYGDRPSFSQIEKIVEKIYEKEEYLKTFLK